MRQRAAAVSELGEEAVDGRRLGDAGGHRELVSGSRGWRNANDGDAGGVQRRAVGVERSRLARAGLADDDVHARTGGGERADHGLLVEVQPRAGGEHSVDDPAGDTRDADVLPAGGALEQFGLGGQQVDGGVAAFRLIDGADDAAGGVADA